MRRLTAIDAQFLYIEELVPAAHQHTIKVSIISPLPDAEAGGAGFVASKETLRARLHLLPPFRWKLVPTPLGLHHPVWVEDEGFDLDYHVRRMGVPVPGGVHELCEMISEIAGWPLDRARPLWELWILEGLEGGRIATIAKVHHALADGVASAELLDRFFDVSPDRDQPVSPDTWRPEAVPSKLSLTWSATRDVARLLVTGLPQIVALTRRARAGKNIDGFALAEQPPKMYSAPVTPFNRQLTAHRSFTVLTTGLNDVKAIRAAFGTTVNDVVLAIAAGGLRAYLIAHDALPSAPLVGGMPVSTRSDDERLTWGNRLAKVYVSLRTDIADPVERLRASHVASEAAKADLARTRGSRLENWIEYLPLPVLRAIGRLMAGQVTRGRASENLIVSNVPGPRSPLFIDGAPMDSFFSVGPLTEGVGLNMTAWSYVDQLNVCLLACREAVPDLWFLTDCLREALVELKKAADDNPRGRADRRGRGLSGPAPQAPKAGGTADLPSAAKPPKRRGPHPSAQPRRSGS